MKRIIVGLSLAITLVASVKAEVEVLPPDFTLFGKNSGDYCAEWHQYAYTLSTNKDYFFPDASPSAQEQVYFLQRTLSYFPTLGVQTYFVPEDVYLYFPIIGQTWDNVDTFPGFTNDELRNLLKASIDLIIDVQLVIDGVPLANPLAYRTESPFFSVYLPTPDNFYSILLGRPFEGLIDPMIAGGYMMMLMPLPPGLHDIRTAYTFVPPIDITRERHFQIYSLTVPGFLAHKTEQLGDLVTNSSLSANRQHPLLATLKVAQVSLSSRKLRAAVGQLGAFQKIVEAQVAQDDALLAGQLTQAAQEIIDKAAAQLK